MRSSRCSYACFSHESGSGVRQDHRQCSENYRLAATRFYSRKKDPKTGKRRNLGTFKTRAAAEKHEREVQYFKRRS